MKVELIRVDAPHRSIVLNDLPVMIGRNQTADVSLDEAGVGDFQCIVERDDGSLSVTDIAGGIGTFVNGNRITRAALIPGDTLRVGRSNFTVRSEL
jgi:pSer/pThr/pTyr-binding forkhead associated (FHA) protein